MENTKLTFMTNQKWKNYKISEKTKNLFFELEKLKKQQQKDDFVEWLNTDISYDKEECLLIKDVLEMLIDEVNSIISSNKNTIINQKRLRDTIASMIYKESRYGR